MKKKKTVKAKRKPAKAKRTGWDRYFMNVASVVASRSTCDRRFVGAVIVKNKTILSTGYNGSIKGLPHCDEVGHMMEGDHCIATIHAEANAIVQAAKNGVSVNGATMYVTTSPCWSCFKMLANAGIKRIVFHEYYGDSRVFETAGRAGVTIQNIDEIDKQ